MKLKSFILTAAAMFSAVAAFALSDTDQAAIAEIDKQLAQYEGKELPEAMAWPVMRKTELLMETPASFGAMLKTFTDALAPVKFADEAKKERAAGQKAVGVAIWRYDAKFIKDAYAYAKAKGLHSRYFAFFAPRLNMSEEEELAGLLETFEAANKCDVWIFKSKTNRFAALLNNLPETEAKAVLKKLNRIYSPLLVKDKATYEPVVVMIRTMLETY